MSDCKCPLCGSKSFFLKDPVDEYETYEFELNDTGPVFDPSLQEEEIPGIEESTDTFCNRCSWHGPYGELEGRGKAR
jgi:hypothetical protein